MSRTRVTAPWLLTVALSVSAAGCPDSPTTPTPPTLGVTCPSAQSGTSIQNQPVTMSWPAPTTGGGKLPVQTTCTPASGSSFQPGVTPVSCTATDAAGQRAICGFSVTVTAASALSMTCPSAQSGISIQNQPVTMSWAAPTVEGGQLPVQTSCAPASGSLFQLGVTSVACTATDAANQRGSCSFNVTITNPPALTLTCPSAQSGVSLQNRPVSISWPNPTPGGGTAPVQTSCAPTSGSTFAAGVTPVSCTAADAAGEHAACAFTVTITRPPQLSVTRFMAYGDSITWGTASPPGTFFAYPIPSPSYSYPNQLQTSLGMRYADQTVSMANEGWPGEAVGAGLDRLPSALMTNNPQVLLLLDGANDLLGNPSSATTEYIASKLRDMVRTAKAQYPTLKVLLATFPPQTRGTIPYDRGAGREFVPELNQRIAAVAQNERVTLVDLYAAFPSNLKPYIGVDGLHPTEQGFTLIAQTFATIIQQTLEVRATGVEGWLR